MSRRTDILLSLGAVALVAIFLGSLGLVGRLDDFGAWAWARHHNILSWYVRTLFLIPFCYFAYRRSILGITLTLIALATSMFWFPVPKGDPGPAVRQILDLEIEYLTGGWTIPKTLIGLLVPLSFAGLAVAFWRRSMAWGVAVINAMILIKIVWTFVFTPGEGAVLHLAPALIGLAIVDAVVIFAIRKYRAKRVLEGA